MDSAEDAGHLWVEWPEYDRMIEQLALRVHASAWRFDQILCLARGGLRVGDVLSRVFDKPLAILSTSSYRAAAGTQQGALDIAEHITMTQDRLAGQVLVVDDLVDSGVTLRAVCSHVRKRYEAIEALRTAVLWQKRRSVFTPDYVVRVLTSDPWIHQPFERYDGMGPDALAQQHPLSNHAH